jgi:hypothetical protein
VLFLRRDLFCFLVKRYGETGIQPLTQGTQLLGSESRTRRGRFHNRLVGPGLWNATYLTVVRPFNEQIVFLPFPQHAPDGHPLPAQRMRRMCDLHCCRMCVTWCIHHPGSRTTRESFPLTWLFRIRVFVIDTLCRERCRDSDRASGAGCRRRCGCDSCRDGAPLSRPLS